MDSDKMSKEFKEMCIALEKLKKEAFEMGKEALYNDESPMSNPFCAQKPYDRELHLKWEKGWSEACTECFGDYEYEELD